MHVINVPLFHCDINFVVGKKELNEFFKEYKKLKKKHKEHILQNAGFCWNLAKHYPGEILVFVHDIDDIDTIAHEMTHTAHYVMKRAGIPIDFANTEIQAYLIGYLVGKALAIRQEWSERS